MQDVETTTTPLKIESFERLPGYDLACRFYSYGKTTSGSLPFVPGLIESAEKNVIQYASPMIENHRETIEKLDKYALGKIGEVEGMVNETKTQFKTTIQTKAMPVVKNGLSFARAAESAMTSPVRKGLGLVEHVVDIVLPSKDENVEEATKAVLLAVNNTKASINSATDTFGVETETETKDVETVETDSGTETDEATSFSAMTNDLVFPGKDVVATVYQCRSLAEKAKRRSYKLAMSKVSDAKLRSTASLESLKHHSVDLIKYAMDFKEKTVGGKVDDIKVLTSATIETATEIAVAARGMASTKMKIARQKVSASAEYIRDYRTLVRTTFVDHSRTTVAYIGDKAVPIKEFIEEQLKNSETWDQFVAKLALLKEQASHAKTKAKANGKDGGKYFYDLMFSNATSMNLYFNFEEFADPYLFNVFKIAREFFTMDEQEATDEQEGEKEEQEDTEEQEAEKEEQATNDDAKTSDAESTADDEKQQEGTDTEEQDDFDMVNSGITLAQYNSNQLDDSTDVEGDANDNGLVLKINPRHSNSFASDIDDESVLND